jgi:putative endonuclease
MTNKSGTFYVGMTNDIKKRVYEHKNKLIAGFTKKYNINRLIYFETFSDVYSAIPERKPSKAGCGKRKLTS